MPRRAQGRALFRALNRGQQECGDVFAHAEGRRFLAVTATSGAVMPIGRRSVFLVSHDDLGLPGPVRGLSPPTVALSAGAATSALGNRRFVLRYDDLGLFGCAVAIATAAS